MQIQLHNCLITRNFWHVRCTTVGFASPKPRPHWLQVISVGRNPRNTLIRILILVVVCSLLFHFVLLPVKVDGISMQPTYKNRSVNIVNRWAYLWHEPRRGDVVAVRFTGLHEMLMKRIIGLPGEGGGG